VTDVVADLEASRSPEDAVRRALDQVGEETSGILQRARETASEITARSRAQADDRLRQAEQEAAEMVADAEARLRELDDDFGRLWRERDRLLDEVRALAERLLATADDAEDRWGAYGEEAMGDETASLSAIDTTSAETAGEHAVEDEQVVAEEGGREHGGAAVASTETAAHGDEELDFSEPAEREGTVAEPAPDGVPADPADARIAGDERRGSERYEARGRPGHEAADSGR
jgi:hypothetical protein